MNRKRWIGLTSASALFFLLIVSGVALFGPWREGQARVAWRHPLQRLGYCNAGRVTPCILSFGQDGSGDMLVSFLTDGAFYPDFYLTIRTGEREHIYVCRKFTTFSTSVYCTGRKLPIGEVFQFQLYSLHEEVLLAQGNFPIIGMALVTPVAFIAPTATLEGLPTDVLLPGTPSGPSYPSYPGTSP